MIDRVHIHVHTSLHTRMYTRIPNFMHTCKHTDVGACIQVCPCPCTMNLHMGRRQMRQPVNHDIMSCTWIGGRGGSL